MQKSSSENSVNLTVSDAERNARASTSQTVSHGDAANTFHEPPLDINPFPWMPTFFCDDVYWLVTVGALVRGLFALEADARQLFGSLDAARVDDNVYLWRLNGGYLCRPCVEVRTLDPSIKE